LRPAPSHLSLYLAAVYTLLAIYASLHPFSGWRDSGVEPFAFLTGAWPRHWTAFDLFVNVVAYVPLGFLWVPVGRRRLGRVGAVLLVTLGGALLSLSMESLQNYLPSRVPSNVDLGCNALGTLLGALAGARWGSALLDGGRLHAVRVGQFLGGAQGDAGLLVLGLWLMTQLTPETLLFGNGDLRELLDLPTPLDYSAERFAQVEAGIVCANTVAVALLATRLGLAPLRLPVFALILVALVIKSFVLALSLGADHGFAWATYGALFGLVAGLVFWLIAALLPARLQQALAAMALLFATVLVNLTPDNPYLANTWQTWNPGQFLNFHGLTKLISALWPFLALPWLMMLRIERRT
jgi:VanZ family protein